jgi:hypothetical protein
MRSEHVRRLDWRSSTDADSRWLIIGDTLRCDVLRLLPGVSQAVLRSPCWSALRFARFLIRLNRRVACGTCTRGPQVILPVVIPLLLVVVPRSAAYLLWLVGYSFVVQGGICRSSHVIVTCPNGLFWCCLDSFGGSRLTAGAPRLRRLLTNWQPALRWRLTRWSLRTIVTGDTRSWRRLACDYCLLTGSRRYADDLHAGRCKQ